MVQGRVYISKVSVTETIGESFDMKKWYMSLLVFLLTLMPLAIVGITVVLLFFGPHSGNTSLAMAMLIAGIALGVPLLLAVRTYRKYQ